MRRGLGGGLPTSEATYVGVDPATGPGHYELVFADVPVDAFWSVSVYNAAGFFEPNEKNLYTVNSVTGVRNDDGSITVRFIPPDAGGDVPPNAIVTPPEAGTTSSASTARVPRSSTAPGSAEAAGGCPVLNPRSFGFDVACDIAAVRRPRSSSKEPVVPPLVSWRQ